jgi:translation elongation factor EF-Ts
LSKLLDLGHCNMQKNLKALKRANFDLQQAILFLRAEEQIAPVAPASTKKRLEPHERHEILGKLLDLGHCNMQKNLKALKRANFDLQQAILFLRAEEQIAPVAPASTKKRLEPHERHEILGKLLDLGHCNMQKNLQALKRANFDLQDAIALLEAERAARCPSVILTLRHFGGNSNN